MRLLSFHLESDPTRRFGMLDRSRTGVVDLTGRTDHRSLRHALRAGLHELAGFVDCEPDLGLDDVIFDRPVHHPGKILCIGVNYGGRAREYDDPTDRDYPSVFVRFPGSLTAHGQALVRPAESDQLDYEGEIVAVIGTTGRRIPADRARSHIAGLTLGNEGTIRDWVRHAKFNVTQGKNWESSGAIGPWIVTLDELPPFDDLTIETRVNGQIRQHDSPRSMKYPIDYQVHYLSTFCALEPGDLIFTGTPTGAGARMDPPTWLQPGDVVEVDVPEIGVLRNTVADEEVDPP